MDKVRGIFKYQTFENGKDSNVKSEQNGTKQRLTKSKANGATTKEKQSTKGNHLNYDTFSIYVH